jgi:uncharacterized damage-inducible protein DinB
MTLHEIKTLLAFNAWASNRIFEATASMTADQYVKDMKSSLGSIHGTLVHMVGAEKLSLARWQGRTEPLLAASDVPSREALIEVWEKTGLETAGFAGTLTDKKLQETFVLKTLKGEVFEFPLWQTFLHVVDHSTYHRGQVITLMRQQGVTPPSTGLLRFYSEAHRR